MKCTNEEPLGGPAWVFWVAWTGCSAALAAALAALFSWRILFLVDWSSFWHAEHWWLLALHAEHLESSNSMFLLVQWLSSHRNDCTLYFFQHREECQRCQHRLHRFIVAAAHPCVGDGTDQCANGKCQKFDYLKSRPFLGVFGVVGNSKCRYFEKSSFWNHSPVSKSRLLFLLCNHQTSEISR